MSNKPEDRVISLLKEAYNAEWETAMNYMGNAIFLEGIRAEVIAEELRAEAKDEIGHAETLGERLHELGSDGIGSEDFTPEQASLQPPEDTTDVLSVIEGVIEAETDAGETYRKLIEASVAADDPVTEDLAVELLADEEHHLTVFEGFRKDYQ